MSLSAQNGERLAQPWKKIWEESHQMEIEAMKLNTTQNQIARFKRGDLMLIGGQADLKCVIIYDTATGSSEKDKLEALRV